MYGFQNYSLSSTISHARGLILFPRPGLPALGGAWGRGYIRSIPRPHEYSTDIGLHCQASASVSRDFKLLDPLALIWPNIDYVVQLLY